VVGTGNVFTGLAELAAGGDNQDDPMAATAEQAMVPAVKMASSSR
jgi:hypothetical protein